jgi:PIN domain nuclease of toxin-antitoxin system
MAAPLLLDTCAAIWVSQGDRVSPTALKALDESFRDGQEVQISPISVWEIGMLAARGRLSLQVRPEQLVRRFLATPHVGLADMSPDVLIASSFLPGTPPRDPADRIIIATAREHGQIIVTRDRPILDYGDAGHVMVLAC